jgi:small subunit ribosomal protein S7e
MSNTARSKIIKPVGQEPDALELSVAQNIYDLEHNVADFKAELKGLQFVNAKEVIINYHSIWIIL